MWMSDVHLKQNIHKRSYVFPAVWAQTFGIIQNLSHPTVQCTGKSWCLHLQNVLESNPCHHLCCSYVGPSHSLCIPLGLPDPTLPLNNLFFRLPWSLSGQESACNAGDAGFIPGPERLHGDGNGYPIQNFCLGNPMDRGAWQAAVRGVRKESDVT